MSLVILEMEGFAIIDQSQRYPEARFIVQAILVITKRDYIHSILRGKHASVIVNDKAVAVREADQINRVGVGGERLDMKEERARLPLGLSTRHHKIEATSH